MALGNRLSYAAFLDLPDEATKTLIPRATYAITIPGNWELCDVPQCYYSGEQASEVCQWLLCIIKPGISVGNI